MTTPGLVRRVDGAGADAAESWRWRSGRLGRRATLARDAWRRDRPAHGCWVAHEGGSCRHTTAGRDERSRPRFTQQVRFWSSVGYSMMVLGTIGGLSPHARLWGSG